MTRAIPSLILALAVAAGCGGGEEKSSSPPPTPSSALAALTLKEDPGEALSVEEAKDADSGTEVVVVGRIGNIVKGFAAFNLVDESLDPCGFGADPMDDCPTPWDYCCIAGPVKAAMTMTVEARSAEGNPLKGKTDLRLLDTVAVKGRIEKDEHGNVTVVADAWFRRERPKLRDGLQWPQ